MKDQEKNEIQMGCWKPSHGLEPDRGSTQHNDPMTLNARDGDVQLWS